MTSDESPDEQIDLGPGLGLDEPPQPQKAAELKQRLKAWLMETKAQLPVPNPAYDAAREREPGTPTGPTTAK